MLIGGEKPLISVFSYTTCQLGINCFQWSVIKFWWMLFYKANFTTAVKLGNEHSKRHLWFWNLQWNIKLAKEIIKIISWNLHWEPFKYVKLSFAHCFVEQLAAAAKTISFLTTVSWKSNLPFASQGTLPRDDSGWNKLLCWTKLHQEPGWLHGKFSAPEQAFPLTAAQCHLVQLPTQRLKTFKFK